MVSEDDPLVGGKEVAAVFETLGGRSAQGIERQHFGGNKTAVEAISDGVGGDGGDDQPQGVDLFAAMQGDGGQRQRSEQADGDPEKKAEDFWHGPVVRWRMSGDEYCGEKELGSQASLPGV